MIPQFGSGAINIGARDIEVFVTGTTVRDTGNGLTVNNGSIARIANSTFTANTVGVRNFSIVETLGNNLVRATRTMSSAR